MALNLRLCFETFVVGTNNQLGYAVSKAVADAPGQVYNPLFLYGGAGVGKSHLLHAIGNHLATNQALSVSCVTGRQFGEEVMKAIRKGKLGRLRRGFQQVQVLLIDDIHRPFWNKRIVEEFLAVLRMLCGGEAQVVFTSRHPPRSLSAIEKCVRGEFEWSLIVEVTPPDLEMGVAIVRGRAQAEGLDLSDAAVRALAIASLSSEACLGELDTWFPLLAQYRAVAGQPLTMDVIARLLQRRLP